MMDRAPTEAELHGMHRLSLQDPDSVEEAHLVAMRLWPRAEPANLVRMVELWASQQRRPKVSPEPEPVVVAKIT